MAFTKFEEILAWQKGQDLAVVIYQRFGQMNDFGYKNQICKATISISNNIAEGYERSSNADFSRFLYIALGSCSEVKSMLYLSVRLGYLNEDDALILINQTSEISKILKGLIKSLAK